MAKRSVPTSGIMLLRLLFALMAAGVLAAWCIEGVLKQAALQNLGEEDARQKSELVFEVLYAQMKDGWSREDLHQTIERLNGLEPGLRIRTYRSPLVEALYGKVPEEQEGIRNDPLITKGLEGKAQFVTDDTGGVRYIRPLKMSHECSGCHFNAQEGDVNGVIDMYFPAEQATIPLEKISSYFFATTIAAIVATFAAVYFLVSRLFIASLKRLSASVVRISESGAFETEVSSRPKTLEMQSLEEHFNALLERVRATLLELRQNAKLLEEYKYAMDISTLVSKTDPNGIITYANDAFCRISGYSRGELIGSSHSIVRSPHMPKTLFTELWETIRAKKVWHGVVENRAKNGKNYVVQATIVPILDIHNELVEYIGIRQDITELKKLQLQELSGSIDRALEIRWDEIVRQISVATVIVDEASRIVAFNSRFEEQTDATFCTGDCMDGRLLEQDGYLSADPVLDWKTFAVEFGSERPLRILLDLKTASQPFDIYVMPVDAEALYTICLLPAGAEDRQL